MLYYRYNNYYRIIEYSTNYNNIRNAHLNDIKADFRASSDKYIPFGVPVVPLENIIAHGQFLFIGFVVGTNRLSEATIFE